MIRVGVICPTLSGHLNPMMALGHELQSRGHEVIFFHIADQEKKVSETGFKFCTFGEKNFPLGSWPKFLRDLEKYKGLRATIYWHEGTKTLADTICRYAPAVIKDMGIQILLVDQMEPAGALVAEYLELPWLTICTSLVILRGASVPPPVTHWTYQRNKLGRWRNQLGHFISSLFLQSSKTVLDQHRRRWHLPAQHIDDLFLNSKLAYISQQPPTFEFPCSHKHKQELFNYVGPFREICPKKNDQFPYEKLTGEPLVYASLGTMQTNKYNIFWLIAQACAELKIQLVLSHGGGLNEAEVESLPGNHVVVSYAPQLELLKKAQLTITHGGLNTVLDSLSHGVPLVVIPIAFEQPGIASRVKWTGTGEVIKLSELNVSTLRANILKVMGCRSYSKNAQKFKNDIIEAGGLKKAADIVEQVFSGGECVSPNNF